MGNIIVTLKPGRSSTSTSASSSSEISVTNITELSNEIVTNDKLVSVGPQTVKANITEDFSAPQDIALSTFTGYLSVFTGDGGEGGAQGLVPAPQAGDAYHFLNGNGIWDDTVITLGPEQTIIVDDIVVFASSNVRNCIKSGGKNLAEIQQDIDTAANQARLQALVYAIALG